jgi:hypothetical protein
LPRAFDAHRDRRRIASFRIADSKAGAANDLQSLAPLFSLLLRIFGHSREVSFGTPGRAIGDDHKRVFISENTGIFSS